MLGGAVALHEFRRVGGSVRGIEHVERRVARERIGLVGDRGIEPCGEDVGSAGVRAQHHERVGRREVEDGVGEVAPRSGKQVRLHRLRLVGGHERRTAGVPEQHDVLDAGGFAQPADAHSDVDERVLQDEAVAVARKAGVPTEEPVAALGDEGGEVVLAEVGLVVRRDQRGLGAKAREVVVDAPARSGSVRCTRAGGRRFRHEHLRDLAHTLLHVSVIPPRTAAPPT